jgi:hypothetical protein
MKYLIQTENGVIDDIEVFQFNKIISKQEKFKIHSKLLSDTYEVPNGNDYIPVGDLHYIQGHLKTYWNIDTMNPIEVPMILRKEKYLRRKYEIVEAKNVPKDGYWFIKEASKLKGWIHLGEVGLYRDSIKSGIYVVSEPVDIISEYRVIVLNGIIQAVRHYDGNPLSFPDVNLIYEMVTILSSQNDIPKAFTMDIATSNVGTILIEVHPFVSVGTYGYYDENLIHLYRFGYEYYRDINKQLELTE